VIQKPFSPKVMLKTINAIFNKSEIPIIPAKNNNPKNGDKLYSLKALKAFLPNEKEALKEVLKVFMTSSRENLELLEQATLDNNYTQIKNITHKMNPMFKQIEAFDISNILDQLELKDMESPEINRAVRDIKNKISVLFIRLEKEIN
jgi:HPt (histidine-containing phosphotransfer) domain-containing protein